MNPKHTTTRRSVLTAGGAAGCGLALPQFANANDQLNDEFIRGKAEHVISIWLGGGMGQIDTFDPKRKGDPKKKLAGSYYESIDTAVPNVQVCEHLPKLAGTDGPRHGSAQCASRGDRRTCCCDQSYAHRTSD